MKVLEVEIQLTIYKGQIIQYVGTLWFLKFDYHVRALKIYLRNKNVCCTSQHILFVKFIPEISVQLTCFTEVIPMMLMKIKLFKNENLLSI